MNHDKYKLIKKWKKTNLKMLMRLHPDIPKKKIIDFLDGQIDKYLKNPKCKLDNNYIGKTINSTLLDLCNWIYETKPICAGHGVFYKNQHEVSNPLAVMISNFLKSRKAFKKRLKDFDPQSYEYATFDRKQLSEKICANSIYGAFGLYISFLFNMYTAPSVTGTGQSLISTTEQAFEAFMTNNLIFNSMDECVTYLTNILNEEYDMDSSFLHDIDPEVLINHIAKMFYQLKDSYVDILNDFVLSLNQDQINHIYYKNNLYEFSKHQEIIDLLNKVVESVDDFKDPNKVPETAKPYLEKLWSYYRTFVLYNYSPINRIQRLKNDRRKCVLTIDTDSNFLHLDPWVTFMKKEIFDHNDSCIDRDKDQLRFIAVNTMAFMITNMMKDVLGKYTKIAGIPEDYRDGINIKNEFLMSRIILAGKKKRYVTSVRLREGSEIYPEKVDVKGFDFMKSSSTEETKERFKAIIRDKIINVENINIPDILNELRQFESEILDSLQNGDKKYLIPCSVSELEAYKEPLREQGVRAVICWNYIYPDHEIILPTKVDIVKLTLTDEYQLEKLKNIDENIYNIIKEKIFNNKDERIANKGLPVIAIPRNFDKVPEWILPFIDYDTITFNVLSKFYSVLNSLGLRTIKTSKKEYFSNILNI